jgi:hypothetical protein
MVVEQELLYPEQDGSKIKKGVFAQNMELTKSNDEAKNGILELGPTLVRWEGKDFSQMAAWERQIRNRSDVITKMKFHENLLRRSRMAKGNGQDGVADDTTPYKEKGIPIRRETYALLIRPPEPDYTFVGIILKVVAILLAMQTIWSQIHALVFICSTGFICPWRGYAGKFPMVAPPVLFRTVDADYSKSALNFTSTWISKVYPWDPELVASTSGYYTHWPYVQIHSGRQFRYSQVPAKFPFTEEQLLALDALAVPVLFPTYKSKGCTLTLASSDPKAFVFDPFTRKIREEFLSCPNYETKFDDIPSRSAVFEMNISNSTLIQEFKTILTFKNADYVLRRDRTIQCMKKVSQRCDKTDSLSASLAVQPKFCCEDLETSDCELNTWWKTIKARAADPLYRNVANEVLDQVEACVNSQFAAEPNICDCSEKNFRQYPLPKFYQGLTPIHICQSGPTAGLTCTLNDPKNPNNNDCEQDLVNNQANNKNALPPVCSPKYPDSKSLSTHEDYGCFFAAPDADREANFEYYKCNFKAPGKVQTSGGPLTRTQSMGLIDLDVSKRAGLVGIFLAKELGMITGFGVLLFLAVIVGVLLILLSPIIGICFYLLNKSKGQPEGIFLRITLAGIAQTVWGIIYGQGLVLYVLFSNLSTTYRAGVNLGHLINLTINKSLVDMDIKINFVTEFIYTMALLLLIDDTGNSSAPNTQGVQAQTNLYVAISTKLLQLLYNIVGERMALHAVVQPLNDLNENRLSKFEAALLLSKMMEDFLLTDINFNFVQLFNSRKPLMPEFDNDPQYDLGMLPVQPEDDGPIEGLFDGIFQDYVSEDWKLRKLVFLEPLSNTARFGHDGQGAFDPYFNGGKTHPHKQSVTVDYSACPPGLYEQHRAAGLERADDIYDQRCNGLIQFMPGFDELSIVEVSTCFLSCQVSAQQVLNIH